MFGSDSRFMQVNHGKAAPLKRVLPGSYIAYYSPSTVMRVKDGLQSFTAVGIIEQGEPYQGFMASGFQPFRRDVGWLAADETSIRPLLDRLEFTKDHANWGQKLRFGLFKVSDHDMQLITEAMGVQLAQRCL